MIDVKEYSFVLSTRNQTHQGQIRNIDTSTISYHPQLNGADEMSFVMYKEFNDKEEPLWDEIVDLKLIYIPELDEYFQITVSLSDSVDTKKTVTLTSLCEAELSQTNLYNIEINTEDDIARKEYTIPTVFYRDLSAYPKDSEDYTRYRKASLLHRILDKVPHYSIAHVDESLAGLQRSFSINGTNIYSFLTGDCAEQFNCLFQFDSVNRTISVYDLYTVCEDCGERGEYLDVCPKCGSTNLKYFGDDTTIFVDKENLTEEVTFTTDIDSVKNCFRLQAGDDNMTAAVINVNPNGSQYIYYINEEQKKDMEPELVERIQSYNDLYNSKTTEYQNIVSSIYDHIDQILYYESGMMPTVVIGDYDAKTEAAKLTEENMSPLGLTTVNRSTSKATVESALKNFAKVFVRTGFFKIEVNDSEFEYVGEDEEHNHYGYWYGNFKISNYATENEEDESKKDIAISPSIRVKVYDLYETFLDQKIKKNIAKEDDTDDGSIYNVLAIGSLDKFKEVLKLYCLNRLTSFYSAIQSVIDIMVEADQASSGADLYESIYIPYYEKLQACQVEIDARQKTLDDLSEVIDGEQKQRDAIQKELNFEAYLGEDLYKDFLAYRREDTYQNDNYISDGMDNDSILKNARDFLDTAKKEIVKSGERQHSLSSSLYNLLKIKEFEPLRDMFKLGNWIRIGVEDNIYRLRLVDYQLDGGDDTTISVSFSDMTKTANGMNDIQSIISKAQAMSSSYSSVSKQAEKGSEAKSNIQEWVKNGLDSSIVQMKNNDNEEVVYDKHGILCRTWDDITESYNPEQLKLTHNVLAFTDDNWQTVRSAIGKHNYTYYNGEQFATAEGYGLSSDFVSSGYVFGSQIVGGDIYSDNYSETTGTHINLRDGTFSLAGGKLTFNGKDIELDGKLVATSGTVGGMNIGNSSISSDNGNFRVSADGKLVAKDATISGIINTNGGTFSGNIKCAGTITGGTLSGATVSGSDFTGGSIFISYIFQNFCYLQFGVKDQNVFIRQLSIDGQEINTLLSIALVNSMSGDFGIKIPILAEDTRVSGDFSPYRDADAEPTYLGKSDYRWQAVYAKTGTIQTSDRNQKDNIKELSEKYIDMFNMITPVSFTYKSGDRTHIGFIAQDVEDAMTECGLTDLDFGGFCKDIVDEKEIYSLRYDEFIAINAAITQQHQKEIESLRKDIDEIKGMLENKE